MRTPLARLYDKQYYKHMELPKKGTITVSFSKGVYTGMSIEMGTLETARNQQNETFYGKQVNISQILFKKDARSTYPKTVSFPISIRSLPSSRTERPGLLVN
jgi:hypothetical protein